MYFGIDPVVSHWVDARAVPSRLADSNVRLRHLGAVVLQSSCRVALFAPALIRGSSMLVGRRSHVEVEQMTVLAVFAVVVVMLVMLLLSSLKIITEYERAVFFRLGHLKGAKGPGLILVFPVIDRIERISLRTVALEVPTQELVTKDSVTVKVNGVTYYVVRDPTKAVMSVQNFAFATAQVAQATLLTVLRQVDLDTLLRERELLAAKLRELIDAATEPWGIEVTMVEVKDVELPEQMRRAMAREAESERERRAKVIHARGEYEAAEKLGQAAEILEVHPAAVQLRTLATLAEIAVEKNSTIVFPLPFDVMRVFDSLARRLDQPADRAVPVPVQNTEPEPAATG